MAGSGSPRRPLLVLPYEIIVVGKEGAIELMNRAHPDGCQPIPNPCQQTNRTCTDHVIQELSPRTVVGGIWNNSRPAGPLSTLLPISSARPAK